MINGIVLDLDGTLISSTDSKVNIKGGSKFEDLIIYKRPYLDDFINYIIKHFKYIYIWSDSLDDYIDRVVKIIFKNHTKSITKIFNRSDCFISSSIYGRKKDMNYIKLKDPNNIKKISQLIILDNISSNMSPAHNRIVVKTMEFDDIKDNLHNKKEVYNNDTELIRLMRNLTVLLRKK
jgi:hypothetical protein